MHLFTLISLALASNLAVASASSITHLKRAATADGTCGITGVGTMGYSCPSAEDPTYTCCSAYGYCGNTTDHCGTGCQSTYGTCSTASEDTGSSDTDFTGRCGPDGNNQVCASDECCSPAGWCGTTSDYCAAPDCLFNYGPACDANKTPAGDSTASISRLTLGSVLVGGGGIYPCEKTGTVALTYDDGPSAYTADLLDLLKTYNAKATFFITGNNNGKGEIDTTAPFPTVIQRMHTDGHQIASHTWSHADLSNITSEQRKGEMIKNEMALRNILGFIPTYMRPPYSSCTEASGCTTDLADLGYHVIYFDLDTSDYLNDDASLIQNSKNIFDNFWTGKTASDSDALVIGHDIHFQTVYNLTEYMLQSLTAKGFSLVTVGECLNDPEANWYRSSSGALSTSSSSSTSTIQVAPSSTLITSSTTSSKVGAVSAAGSSSRAASSSTTSSSIGVVSVAGSSSRAASSSTTRAVSTTRAASTTSSRSSSSTTRATSTTTSKAASATTSAPASSSSSSSTGIFGSLVNWFKGIFGF